MRAVHRGGCASRAFVSSGFHFYEVDFHFCPSRAVVCASRTGRTQDREHLSIYFTCIEIPYIAFGCSNSSYLFVFMCMEF